MIINQLIQESFLYLHIIINTHSINEFVFMFFLFSFMGWLLEMVYRSLKNRQLINPGFLRGPIVPIYGVAGIFILLTHILILHESILIRLVIYFCAISTLEFLTGEAMLRVFRKRYWDYTDDILNLRGHVCLPFSIAWAFLSIIVETTVYPVLCQLMVILPVQLILIGNIFAILAVQVDIFYTMNVVDKVRFVLQNKIRLSFPRRTIFAQYSKGVQFVAFNLRIMKLRLPETPKPYRFHLPRKEKIVFSAKDWFFSTKKEVDEKIIVRIKRRK